MRYYWDVVVKIISDDSGDDPDSEELGFIGNWLRIALIHDHGKGSLKGLTSCLPLTPLSALRI